MDEYIGESSRKKDRVSAIAQNMSDQEWLQLRKLAKAFYENFDTSVSFFPVGDDEVWFVAVTEMDLQAAESFIRGFLANTGR